MGYLIDGNNFLGFAFPGQIRDPESRMALVRKLMAFQHFTGARVTLVFDGRLSDDIEELAKGEKRFRVLHPREEESADDVIYALIDRQRDRRRLFVVSSDRQVKAYAREAGARPLTCKEFDAELKAVLKERKAVKEMEKPRGFPSSLEVGLWMDIFGEKKR